MPQPTAILIAGPTASGKSALALDLARRRHGVVVNADALQVYRELAILTARPTPAEERSVPHRLFGHVPAAEAYSTGRWLADVAAVLIECRADGRLPIIVGGTGLYFRALLHGLASIPPIPAEVRERWRAEAARLPAGALHAALANRDAVMAARLAPGDTHRVTRALEVIEATGRSLAAWQQMTGPPLLAAAACERLVVTLPRAVIHARCDSRFDTMLGAGALAEVGALAALGLDPGLPAMRALGVRPLLAHLRGALDLGEAVAAGKLESRQYVKRQETWLRRHMADWPAV